MASLTSRFLPFTWNCIEPSFDEAKPSEGI
jgi:hypothetical protein